MAHLVLLVTLQVGDYSLLRVVYCSSNPEQSSDSSLDHLLRNSNYLG